MMRTIRTLPSLAQQRSRWLRSQRPVALLPTGAWPQETGQGPGGQADAGAAPDLPGLPQGRGPASSGSTRPTGSGVEAKRDARRAKRLLGQAYEAEDYIAQQPPKYAGPELPADIAKIVTEVKPPVPERAAADGQRLPGARQGALRLRADADHRARVQAQVCRRGARRRPDQGPGGAHLRAGDGRAGHLRHAVGLQSDDQAGPADLLGAGLRAAAARQLDRRARQARRAASRGACWPWQRRPARRPSAPRR